MASRLDKVIGIPVRVSTPDTGKGWRKLKSCLEMNVLCIADQDNQKRVIALGHTSSFKVI